jgi:hypothetical protein
MAQNSSFPWVRSQSIADETDRNGSRQLQKLQTVFSAFQESGADPGLALDLLLHELAVEARSLSGVGSSAIALRLSDNDFVCRAAAGKSAPGLGTRIEAQDGLSAECVRTGRQQVCQDTETDSRVDAEVCRVLGVRSLVIVPLFLEQRLIGILEAFAPAPHAFERASILYLAELGHSIVQTVAFAEARLKNPGSVPNVRQVVVKPWVEVAGVSETERVTQELPEIAALVRTRQTVESATPVVTAPLLEPEVPVSSPPPATVERYFVEPSVAVVPLRSRRNLGLALVALVAGLIAAAGLLWLPNDASRAIIASSDAFSGKLPSVAPTAMASTSTPASVASRGLKPSAGHQSAPASSHGKEAAPATPNPTQSPRTGGLVVYEKGKVVYRALPGSGQLIGPVTSAAETEKLRDTTDAKVDGNTGPKMDRITGGALIQQVVPVIPSNVSGLQLPLEVELEGIITHDGTVRDLRFVRGDERLSAAAIEAARQWRYEPFRSNGEAVDMLSTLSVRFH